MAVNLYGRDFLKEVDFSAVEFEYLLNLAAELKSLPRARHQHLVGQHIGLIFEKTSTRTRAAFEVAAHRQGAAVTYIDPHASQIGHKESIADSAKVLSRFFDAVQYRGHGQSIVEELAEFSDVPVYNGLTDEWHPTQMLADFLTMREYAKTSNNRELSFAYLGDARNNMGNSFLVTAALLGSDIRIAAPRSLWPNDNVQGIAQNLAQKSGAKILLTENVEEAVSGVGFIHTDVWVSMGEAHDVWASRIETLKPYRVTKDVMALSGRSDTRFMHCLPAFHDQKTTVGAEVAVKFGLADGIEVSEEVFSSRANIAFDQAENRLHTIEALLVATLSTDIKIGE